MDEAVHSAQLVRFGLFEVDLAAGELRKSGVKLKLAGQPFQVLASPGMDASLPNLSRDGRKLAFSGDRGGNLELRETSLPDGREVPIVADDFYSQYYPQWSPDGAYLAHTCEEPSARVSS